MKKIIGLSLLSAAAVMSSAQDSMDIKTTSFNDQFHVVGLSVDRIADDNSPKIGCQTFHFMLKFYWAPKEWEVALEETVLSPLEVNAVVERDAHQNSKCGADLITALNVQILDTVDQATFEQTYYVYNDGVDSQYVDFQCFVEARENPQEWESDKVRYCKVLKDERVAIEGSSEFVVRVY